MLFLNAIVATIDSSLRLLWITKKSALHITRIWQKIIALNKTHNRYGNKHKLAIQHDPSLLRKNMSEETKGRGFHCSYESTWQRKFWKPFIGYSSYFTSLLWNSVSYPFKNCLRKNCHRVSKRSNFCMFWHYSMPWTNAQVTQLYQALIIQNLRSTSG